MSAKLSLRVKTRLDELERAAAVVADFGQAQDWPPDVIFQLRLLLEELGINIIHHGHDDSAHHEIEIEVSSDAKALTIAIIDDARAFNPLTDAPAPDLESTLADRAVGGLGIHLVRTMTDEMHYRRERGKNHLTLVKRRSG